MSKNKIIKLIAELAMLETNEINCSDNLTDIGIDSLMTVELIVKLEEEFGFVCEASELDPENLTTVESIIQLVEQH